MDEDTENVLQVYEKTFTDKKTKTLAPPVFIKGGKFDPISVLLKFKKKRKI